MVMCELRAEFIENSSDILISKVECPRRLIQEQDAGVRHQRRAIASCCCVPRKIAPLRLRISLEDWKQVVNASSILRFLTHPGRCGCFLNRDVGKSAPWGT